MMFLCINNVVNTIATEHITDYFGAVLYLPLVAKRGLADDAAPDWAVGGDPPQGIASNVPKPTSQLQLKALMSSGSRMWHVGTHERASRPSPKANDKYWLFS